MALGYRETQVKGVVAELALKEQDATAGDHDQIGKARMHAHADEDGLADLAAPIIGGDFVHGMMDDGIARQRDA